MSKHFCNNFYLSFYSSVYRISLYICCLFVYNLFLNALCIYLIKVGKEFHVCISNFYIYKIFLLVWLQRKMWTRWLCKSSTLSTLNKKVFLLSYVNGACRLLFWILWCNYFYFTYSFSPLSTCGYNSSAKGFLVGLFHKSASVSRNTLLPLTFHRVSDSSEFDRPMQTAVCSSQLPRSCSGGKLRLRVHSPQWI